MSSAPEPGFYVGEAAASYHQWGYLNATRLKEMDRSPLHARYETLHPKEPTKAMDEGQGLHLAVLERERFESEFVIPPDVGDRRFAEPKAKWKAFLEQVDERKQTILDPKQYSTITGMADAVLAHRLAQRVIGSKGYNEAALVWDDMATNLRCRAKIDLLRMLGGTPTAVDIKSTTDASPGAFAREVIRRGYHIQAGHYTRGLDQHFSASHHWIWLAVEKAPPHAIAVYELDLDDLRWCQKRATELAHQWAACEKTNDWPGYTPELRLLALPAWAKKSGGWGAEDVL